MLKSSSKSFVPGRYSSGAAQTAGGINSSRSFTLAEVLITTVILVGAIVFIFRSFVTALNSVKLSQNISMGCLLAEDKIWQIEQYYKKGLTMESSGSQMIGYNKYDWSYSLTEEEASAPPKMNFSVSWEERNKEDQYSLAFISYLPDKN